METQTKTNPLIEAMFKAGAHFGYVRSRRHPSVKPYLWGTKNKVEIFNLEKTSEALEAAKEFVKETAKAGGAILFVGGKQESQEIILKAAESISMPYVSGRWLGGTLTNFTQIRKRVSTYEDLVSKREKGEFVGKYTKKERLLIDRKIDKMHVMFSGLIALKDKPAALFVIDPRREHIAVAEAHLENVPIIGLCGSDSDLKEVDYPIPGNDTSIHSISFFVQELVESFKEGRGAKV
ncbi:MAG: 30S ribosomal protein S2 [Patescibacteria group bacterium]